MRHQYNFTKLKNLLQSFCYINIVNFSFNIELEKKSFDGIRNPLVLRYTIIFICIPSQI